MKNSFSGNVVEEAKSGSVSKVHASADNEFDVDYV